MHDDPDSTTPGAASCFLRTVLGDRDRDAVAPGYVYAHEHLIIDSPLIADRFPDIHLASVSDAVAEVAACREAGVGVMVDAMPCSAGRDANRLADISLATGVDVIAATGLHHDRYYGPSHWSNNVSAAELADLFVADLVNGIDDFDYTGPIVRRSAHRAGVLKVATSSAELDDRDRRNLDAVAEASVRTGAPVLTHCEGGRGGLEQIMRLKAAGVPGSSIILSHVDKVPDTDYLTELMEAGAVLELDQSLKNFAKGTDSMTVRLIASLSSAGYDRQMVVGTDGARRTLWATLGGTPGLAWLGSNLPTLLREVGVTPFAINNVMRDNALRAFAWRLPVRAAKGGQGV